MRSSEGSDLRVKQDVSDFLKHKDVGRVGAGGAGGGTFFYPSDFHKKTALSVTFP